MKTHYFVHPPLDQSCVVLFIKSPGKLIFKFVVCLSIVGKDRDSLVVQRLRLCVPNAGGLGSIPGQGTRSHMPQLRVHMLQPSN